MAQSGSTVALRVHVPVACFRRPYAREFWESYPVSPPSTVYGMLLSLVGEVDRLRHTTARVAVARLREAEISKVLRIFYRWKDKKISSNRNRAPDWQQLLTDVRIAVWVADGDNEPAQADTGTLRQRVRRAMDDPVTVTRFGGLCLGESTHLIDGVWPLSLYPPDEAHGERRDQLIPAEDGDLTLPVWPDHVGSRGTRWARYRFRTCSPDASVAPEDFTIIQPPSRELEALSGRGDR